MARNWDRRVWTPDETCRPFHISNVRASAAIGLAQFEIPVRHRAVIVSLLFNTLVPSGGKEDVILKIGHGPYDPGGSTSNVRNAEIDYNPGILSLIEPGLGGSIANVPGFVAMAPATPPRPVRIYLNDSGVYTLAAIPGNPATAGTNQAYTVEIFGWTFPYVQGGD